MGTVDAIDKPFIFTGRKEPVKPKMTRREKRAFMRSLNKPKFQKIAKAAIKKRQSQ